MICFFGVLKTTKKRPRELFRGGSLIFLFFFSPTRFRFVFFSEDDTLLGMRSSATLWLVFFLFFISIVIIIMPHPTCCGGDHLFPQNTSRLSLLLFAPTTILSPLRTLVRHSRGLKTKTKENIQKWTYFKTQ